MISVQCPCGARLKCDTHQLGKLGQCPACGETIQMPVAVEALPVEDVAPPPLSYEQPAEFEPVRLSDRPRRPTSSNMVVPMVLAGLVVAGLAVWLLTQSIAANAVARPDRDAAARANRPAGAEESPSANAAVLLGVPCTIVSLLMGLVFYVLPSVIAVCRKHHNAAAIIAVNILLGLTGIGWVVALVWALTAVDSREHYHYHSHGGRY
jgi:Superinfection immunity protein